MPVSPILPRLLAGSVSPQEFTHRDHLQAAWECFQSNHPDDPGQLAASLYRLAAGAGAPERYHATITGAFLTLIRAAMEPQQTFAGFAENNPGLFERDCLLAFYSQSRLDLPEARQRFLVPDRQPLPPCPVALSAVEVAAG